MKTIMARMVNVTIKYTNGKSIETHICRVRNEKNIRKGNKNTDDKDIFLTKGRIQDNTKRNKGKRKADKK